MPASPGGRICVGYLVNSEGCAPLEPAEFSLGSVMTMDSNGAIDTLQRVGAATIMEGQPGTIIIEDVQPSAVVQGANATLDIRGTYLGSASRILLRTPSGAIEATNVVTVGTNHIQATLPIPADYSGPLDLITLNGAVHSQIRSDALVVLPLGSSNQITHATLDTIVGAIPPGSALPSKHQPSTRIDFCNVSPRPTHVAPAETA